MSHDVDRRSFLKGTLRSGGAIAAGLASAGVATGLGHEERILLAQLAKEKDPAKAGTPNKEGAGAAMPQGKIGDLAMSRLICGGNLIGGWAHSRDLIYSSRLFKAYNTDEKIMETLQLCEEHGVNAILTNPVSGGVINRYWRERGGKIQWICEAHPKPEDFKTDIRENLDRGAALMYIQGGEADRLFKNGQLDLIAKTVAFIKENGVPAGVGAHALEVVAACEEKGVNPDFYVKTLHSNDYWSAKRDDQTQDVISNGADNYWCLEPEKTIEFMKTVAKPWVAFKVMAAGAIHPKKGFRHAFENGADFVCAGMFDFQVAEDAAMAVEILADLKRDRPWQA